jgi:beta-glucosidase
MNGQEEETKIQLPEGFLLGAAASAHQVEGDNFHNDWWHYEQEGRLPKSGKAADHYNRYEEDFVLAQKIGLNAMRISIEWSRIEPLEGRWDKTAIEHYRKVLKSMKERGLVRMATLHHFTLPMWLAEKGGFETSAGSGAFARFCWFVAKNLGEEVDLWVTLNEPEIYAGQGYKNGSWPPFKKNFFLFLKVTSNLIKAHKQAYSAIRQAIPGAKIGIAKNSVYFEPFRKNNFLDRLVVFFADWFGNHYFLNRVKNHLDFIGLNYYFYHSLRFKFPTSSVDMNYNFMVNRPTDPPEVMRSDMGWRTFPEGIYHVLKNLKKYSFPVYITENGIANARDDMRKDFIREHLYWALKAKEEGVDLKGYFYWSLTDNFEWADGFGPLFGLFEVNYETQERKLRASAEVFKEIKTNG